MRSYIDWWVEFFYICNFVTFFCSFIPSSIWNGCSRGVLGDGSWCLSYFKHPSWFGSVIDGCHKYFQHHLLKNHLVQALHNKKPIVLAFPFVWSFYVQYVPFFFNHHSLSGKLSVIHFLVGTCQGDLLIGPLFALAHFQDCDVMKGVLPLIFSLPLMTFTSLTLFLSFFFFWIFFYSLGFCGVCGWTLQMFDLVAFWLFSLVHY